MDIFDDIPDLNGPARKKIRKKPKAAKDQVPVRAVVYKAPRCPKCGVKRPNITRTMPPVGRLEVRYHECQNCGYTFKSITE